MGERFSVGARLHSFVFALSGLSVLLREQHNARIHLLAVVVVVTAGAFTGLSALEWALLVLACALVFLGEALNSAVEYLADAAVPEQHPLVAKAKDVAAAGVLLAALAAVLVGALLFIPKWL